LPWQLAGIPYSPTPFAKIEQIIGILNGVHLAGADLDKRPMDGFIMDLTAGNTSRKKRTNDMCVSSGAIMEG